MLLFYKLRMRVGCRHVSGRNMLFPLSEQGEKQIASRRNISVGDNCSICQLCEIKMGLENIFNVTPWDRAVRS